MRLDLLSSWLQLDKIAAKMLSKKDNFYGKTNEYKKVLLLITNPKIKVRFSRLYAHKLPINCS